jgi:phage replication O-like protein O
MSASKHSPRAFLFIKAIMANPQPDKFTKFSNELLEAYINIVRHLSPYENSVWLCVFRKTYGYKQKEDWISLSQIEIMTGIRQPHVARSKKKLLLKNMIAKRNGGIGIQKDYDEWSIPKQVYITIPKQVCDIPKQALPKQVIELTQTGNKDLPKQVDTKDNDKDTITKEGIIIPPSLEKVSTYCKDRNNGLNAETFVNYYTSKGWMIGKNKMKDWQAAVRTWEQRNQGIKKQEMNTL